MAGLSNFITNTATQSTTMPTWYDTAQQNVVNQATQGAGNVPTLQNTVAGQAINQLSNPSTNPFTQAQGTLGQIASGAANPWITDASGNVTPNTGTALGGLFQAQNQQLQQLMPNITAQPNASAIGSGQFGSLRGQTAENKALADAQAQLTAQQMQNALQNQQTGVSAATGQGAVGSQGVTSMTNLGQAQQADPLLAASALGKIVGGINAPTTVTNATQLSPLNQIGSIASALGGSVAGTDTLLKQLFPATGGSPTLPNGQPNPAYKPAQGLGSIFGNIFGNKTPSGTTDTTGNNSAGTYPLDGGGSLTINPDGSQSIKNADGSVTNYDPNGNPISANTNYDGTPTTPDLPVIDPSMPTDSSGNIDYSGNNWGGG
jgi:hypothetical protein